MSTTTRDLGSRELWLDSLDRSRRRRELAEDARRTISRRKQASFALSAAMAATPVAPTLLASAATPSKSTSESARQLRSEPGDKVLLEEGAVSPSVAQVQRRLSIPDDGDYGPVTVKAVTNFQGSNGLDPTGKIDVRTWLKLFPHGMIIYAPQSQVAQLAAYAPQPAASSGSAQPAVDVGPVADTGSSSGQSSASGDSGSGAGQAEAVALSGGRSHGSSVGSSIGTRHGAPKRAGSSPASPASGNTASSGTAHNTASAPAGSANSLIQRMIAEADSITAHHYAYEWGGGHNSSFSGPYDCSGAVSAVLHAAGLLNAPMVSGDFMHWGAPGPGAVTIYANADHVYMSILGRFFGTSSMNPGGGAAWFNGAPRPGFVVVHVPFEALHLSSAQTAAMTVTERRKKRKHRHHLRTAAEFVSVTPGFNGQAPGSTDASSSDPSQADPAQTNAPSTPAASQPAADQVTSGGGGASGDPSVSSASTTSSETSGQGTASDQSSGAGVTEASTVSSESSQGSTASGADTSSAGSASDPSAAASQSSATKGTGADVASPAGSASSDPSGSTGSGSASRAVDAGASQRSGDQGATPHALPATTQAATQGASGGSGTAGRSSGSGSGSSGSGSGSGSGSAGGASRGSAASSGPSSAASSQPSTQASSGTESSTTADSAGSSGSAGSAGSAGSGGASESSGAGSASSGSSDAGTSSSTTGASG